MKVQAGLKAKVPQVYRWVALKETKTRIKLKHCVWGDRESGCLATCPTRLGHGLPPHFLVGRGPRIAGGGCPWTSSQNVIQAIA